MDVFVHLGKPLTDLQILGCEWHQYQNTFGGQARPKPAGGAIALPIPITIVRGRGERGRG